MTPARAGAGVAPPAAYNPGVARLDAIDRLVRDHAAKEAAQLAAGVCAWETDTSGRLSALEQRLAGIEREATVRQTESSRPTLGDLRKARGLS